MKSKNNTLLKLQCKVMGDSPMCNIADNVIADPWDYVRFLEITDRICTHMHAFMGAETLVGGQKLRKE